MTERNYWVLCDDNCRFPAMTKEQIYDAIAEATGMTPTPVDEAFITMIKEQNANHNMKFWHGTEAQFNALEETDPDTVYVIGTNKVKSVDALEAAVSELQEEVQPVDRGGTGATTAEGARANLGLDVDYVVEEGTSGIWTYRKWASGVAECWGKTMQNITAGTAYGNIRYGSSSLINFPFEFIETPDVVTDVKANQQLGWTAVSGDTSKSRVKIVIMSSQTTGDNWTFSIHAIGRWK